MLGLRQEDGPISYNEYIWLRAYYEIWALDTDLENIAMGKMVASFRGGAPIEFMLDGFNKKHDAIWAADRDEAIKARLRKRKKELMEKLAKEKAERERLENGNKNN